MEYPAYVLHSRPYHESNALIDFFTLTHGRKTAVLRSARDPKTNLQGILQPFNPLLISWLGRNELVTISQIEPNGIAHTLSGNNCISGLYLNELLMRLLQRDYPLPNLFNCYQNTLINLTQEINPEACLRNFEMQLLKDLGYGLELNREAVTGADIQSEKYYVYQPHRGLSESQGAVNTRFSGKHLLAIHAKDFQEAAVRQDAKKILRQAIQAQLGNKPVQSRMLFGC